jgi:hypothetical protein
MVWTCQHCGRENARAERGYGHGRKKYLYEGCRCDICTEAVKRRQSRYVQSLRDAAPNPPRKNYEWTSAELETAGQRNEDGSYKRTARETAVLLGRSVFAVKQMRRKMLHPHSREDTLAGLPRKADQ